MKVLLLVHDFLPNAAFGAELYTYYLATHLQARGANVRLLFTTRDTAGTAQRVYDNLHCTVVNYSPSRGPLGVDTPNPTVAEAVRDLLHTFKPDVVHITHLLYLSYDIPRIAKEAGCKVIFTLMDYWLLCPKIKLLDWHGQCCSQSTPWKCAGCCRTRVSRLYWKTTRPASLTGLPHLRYLAKELYFQAIEHPLAWLRMIQRSASMRSMIPHVDVFHCPSRYLLRRMREWGVSDEKLFFARFGTMELDYKVPDSRNREGPLRIGYLGAPTVEKGLHVLLEAFRKIDDAHLLVYGATQERLSQEFPHLPPQSNVTACGVIDDKQKMSVIPQLDALVVPSIWHEIGPIVVLESFRARVPVICSDIGGMRELVTDAVDGLHFRSGDEADLRRVIRRCIDEPELLDTLRDGIQPPLSMAEHVEKEVIPLYGQVDEQSYTNAHSVELLS